MATSNFDSFDLSGDPFSRLNNDITILEQDIVNSRVIHSIDQQFQRIANNESFQDNITVQQLSEQAKSLLRCPKDDKYLEKVTTFITKAKQFVRSNIQKTGELQHPEKSKKYSKLTGVDPSKPKTTLKERFIRLIDKCKRIFKRIKTVSEVSKSPEIDKPLSSRAKRISTESDEKEMKLHLEGLSPRQRQIYFSITNNPDLTEDQRAIVRKGYCRDLPELIQRFKKKSARLIGTSIKNGLSSKIDDEILFLTRGEDPQRFVDVVRYNNIGGVPPDSSKPQDNVKLTEKTIVLQVSADHGSIVPECSTTWGTGFDVGGIRMAVIIDTQKDSNRGKIVVGGSGSEEGVLMEHKMEIETQEILWVIGRDFEGEGGRKDREAILRNQLLTIKEANARMAKQRPSPITTDRSQSSSISKTSSYSTSISSPSSQSSSISSPSRQSSSIASTSSTQSSSISSPMKGNQGNPETPNVSPPSKSAEPEKGSLKKLREKK